MFKRIAFFAVLMSTLALGSMDASAQRYYPTQQPAGLSGAEVRKANATTVGLMAASLGGVYIQIAANLANVLDEKDKLRILPIVGRGGSGNLEDLLYVRGVDIAILGTDVLRYVKIDNRFHGDERAIQYIAKLYDQEVHLLARPDIKSVADLKDQKVNVDTETSGSALTSKVLFDGMKLHVQYMNDPQEVALEKLKRGDIAAIFYIVGKPAPLFRQVQPQTDATKALHFIPIEFTPDVPDVYLPAKFTHADYPALVSDGQAVNTVAAGVVLAAYGWPANTERGMKVTRFVDALFAKFPQLLQPPNTPKWKDVNLLAEVPGWTRLPAAVEAIRRKTSATAVAAKPATN